MEKTLALTIQVPFARIADAVCSAFEGGSAYWCGTVTSPQKENFEFWYADAGFWALPDFSATFNHDGEGSSEGENNVTTRVGPKKLREGLRIMAEKYPSYFADVLSGEGDANTGDVLLQCVVLGDVLFG
jgi:hypothetical protein